MERNIMGTVGGIIIRKAYAGWGRLTHRSLFRELTDNEMKSIKIRKLKSSCAWTLERRNTILTCSFLSLNSNTHCLRIMQNQIRCETGKFCAAENALIPSYPIINSDYICFPTKQHAFLPFCWLPVHIVAAAWTVNSDRKIIVKIEK